MGLLTEVVPAGKHMERALALAEGLANLAQHDAHRPPGGDRGIGDDARRGADAGGEGGAGGVRRRPTRGQALRGRRGRGGAGAGHSHPPAKSTRTYILVGMAYFVTERPGLSDVV